MKNQNNKWSCFGLIMALLSLSISITACHSTDESKIAAASNPLFVDPATRDFSRNPELLERILSSPHGYFRFINIPFSQEVCRRFSESLSGTPAFNLHGDAHIEQYAVTDLGRGLTDFDDSSTGPAVLDLLRFGVSLNLACKAQGWSKQTDKLLDKFISGYRMTLLEPDTEAEEPTLVKRLKSRFEYNREKYFVWIDSLMQKMPRKEYDELFTAMTPYIESMISEGPELTKEFFQFQKAGYLRMGIGSALDIKYLVRIHGKTSEPFDDVVLEIKQIRDISGIDCIAVPQKSDPFRVLVGQARIAYQPYNFLGYIRFRNYNFWVHSWVDNYIELKIGASLQSVEELAEVVYDVGIQLGRGHTNQIASPRDVYLRREQIDFLNKYESKIKKICSELAKQTIAAWEQFSLKVESG